MGPRYRVDGADYAFDGWIRAELEARAQLMRDVVEQLPSQIAHFADLLFVTLQSGGKLLFAGNGGSAATAQHLAAEFVGRLRRERAPMAALALNADTITLTALSNDFGVEMAYVRPLQALARKEDALILLTTSGRSPNLVTAGRAARAIHCPVVAMTGARGGPVADDADLWLAAPTDNAPCVQEAHLVIGHVVCELVESRIFTGSHGHADVK